MSPAGVRRASQAAATLALMFSIAWLPACSKQAALPLLPNQRPTLDVTQAPASSTQPFFYAYEVRWAGFDADGRIDHFRYAIDPPTEADADTPWVNTNENRKSFLFHSDKLDSLSDQTAEGYHTLVLEAVDDRGDFSAPVTRSFTSFTIAPTVQIVQPVLNHHFTLVFGPSVRIRWTGNDPDGRTTNQPVKYKFKVFPEGGPDFDFSTIFARPDSVRRRYAPHFTEWDSVGGDTTSVDIRDLVPGRRYVAVVVAFDEVGAYSPIMDFDTNMMFFDVTYAGLAGPKMTVSNESFFFTYSSGGFSLDPASFIHTESPAGRPIHFNWSATTAAGGFVSGYRWMLDGNVNDETERKDEQTDIDHWSRYSPLVQSVDLPPMVPAGGSEVHFLYIEAQDNLKQVSIAVVRFVVVKAIFDKDLLIVDDTRLVPDHEVPGGCVDRPRGVWPTAAELDTFFFARGGAPWKCYPAGTLSPVGIFQGYSYDTLGTRSLPLGTLTLQQLSHYRHMVWFTNLKAALNINDPDYALDPMSQLRWLSRPGRPNPIGTWVSQGGELWMFGGGAASALQISWEKGGTRTDVYSSADGELVPGRFMYDVFGWRSEITARQFAQGTKPNHPIGRTSASPDYSSLPDYLFEKYPDTDPINLYAPNRIGTSDYFQSSEPGEGLTQSNEVLEDLDPDPEVTREASVLDTVFESVGGQLGSGRPVMTLWHGGTHGQKQVFSGFGLWYWQRPAEIAIVDWVLQTVWGLPRQDIPR